MAESPTLFDQAWRRVENVHGLSRWNDRDTAKDAAKTITGKTERLLLLRMTEREDWTADELCEAMPLTFPPTLKSALSRLANHHLIYDTGLTRPSNRGRSQIVWAPLNASGPK